MALSIPVKFSTNVFPRYIYFKIFPQIFEVKKSTIYDELCRGMETRAKCSLAAGPSDLAPPEVGLVMVPVGNAALLMQQI